MVSRKDLTSVELDTVKVSKNPTTVVTTNGEVPTKEEATVYVREWDLFVTVMLLEDCGSGQKPQKDRLQYSELRTTRHPWSIDKLFKRIFTYISNIFTASNRNSHGASRINKKWEYEWGSTRRLVAYSLVDECVPEHPDASSSSHELPSEMRAKVVSGKHRIFTHFPKDRNCDLCLRTKITRASCRTRTGTVVPRADNFGELVTADHKVLSEGCESRHNHRYGVVVQDLAIQWIQSYPCKTKTSPETQKSLQKFLEPTRKQKVISIEEILWRSFLESLYVNTTQIGNKWDCREGSVVSKRRDTCGTVVIRSGKMVGGVHEVSLLSAKHSRFLSDGKTPCARRFGIPCNGPVIPFGAVVEYHPLSAKDISRLQQFGPEVLPGIFLVYVLYAGVNLKRNIMIEDIEELEEMDASEIHARRLNAKEVLTPMNGG